MATRALAAAGRRVAEAELRGFPALASSRNGFVDRDDRRPHQMNSIRSAHTQRAEEERHADDDSSSPITAAQVEAALNCKNVEEEVGAAQVLPEEDADAAWVPDQDTGVFVPAEEATAGGSNGTHDVHGASVLDQTVFNREEEMEDVERPAVDMDNNGDAN